jgi:hypothetical protein
MSEGPNFQLWLSEVLMLAHAVESKYAGLQG